MNNTVNISEFVQMPNLNDVVKDIFNNPQLKEILQTSLKIAIAILIVYLILKLISFIYSAIQNRRIKKTYTNTEEIKERLNVIEEKLDKIIGKKSKKQDKEEKEDKTEKKK